MRFFSYVTILWLIVSISFFALIHSAYSYPIYGSSSLATELNSLIRNESANADVSIYVKSMKQRDTLYTHNIYSPMMPASTLKILTAEASLLYLKPEYRFSTQLLTDAKEIKNGILQGNLYIVLTGDPTLTYKDLEELILSLRAQQIQAIAGNVYIDDTAYDKDYHGPGWIWKDKEYCYAAPISADIVNRNCLSFKVSSGKIPGRPAQIVTSAKYFYPVIRNAVMTKVHRAHCSVRLSTDPTGSIVIDGCIPKGREWGVSYVVNDISSYNRALFKTLLSRLSVVLYGNVIHHSAPTNLSLIAQHASKPLFVLVHEMMKKSDNVIAGALFKKIGQLYTHKQGSWSSGSYAVSQILAKYAGINGSLRILDGSGLSPHNLTTSAQMMQVLDFAYHHYPTSYEFISALPIAGIDGTLKHRMHNISRKVRAKTGTISGVVSLAGYVVSADKEPLAFVIMINGNKGYGWRYKTLEDKIATLLTRYSRV